MKETEVEETFRIVFDQLIEGCQIVGPDGCYIYVNKTAEIQYRCSKEKLVGKKFIEVWPDIAGSKLLRFMNLCIEKKLSHNLEEVFSLLDGTVKQFKFNIQPIPLGVVILSQEIAPHRVITDESIQHLEQFEHVFEDANVGKSITMVTGEMFVNQAFCSMIGYSEQELKNKKWQEITPSEEINTIQIILDSILEGTKNTANFTKRYIHKNGSIVWTEISVALHRDNQNKPQYFITTVFDITDKKWAEQQLVEQAHFLNLLINHIPDQIFWKDINLNYLGCNLAFADVVGLKSTSDVVGLSDFDFKRDIAHAEEYRNNDLLVIKTGIPQLNFEEQFHNAEGEEGWVATSKIPLRDTNENIIGLLGICVDITKQKMADIAIHTNERLLKLFIEHTPAAIAMFDTNMNYIVASKRFLSDYDLGDREVVGKSHYEIFPDIPDRWKAVHRRCLAGAIEKEDEDPFPRADGTLDWIRWEIHPWHIQPNEIGGVILFSEVITNQKMAREALQESEAYNRMLFNQSAIGLVVNNMDGIIVDANPKFAHIIGRTTEGCKTLTYWDITPSSYNQQEEIQLHFLNTIGRYGPYEKEYIHRDGHLVPVRLQGLLIERNGQKFIWSSVEDITDQKQAEKTLRESEEKFRKAFKTSPDAININRISDGMYIEVNKGFESVIGYHSDEVIGKTSVELNIWKNPEDRIKLVTDLTEKGSCENLEAEFVTKNGKIIIGSMSATFIEINNENVILSITRDISERKKAEATILRQLSDLTILNHVAQRLQLRFELQDLSHELISILEQTLNYDYAAILLIDESNHELIPFAYSYREKGGKFTQSDQDYLVSKEITVDQGITGWVVRHGKSICSGNIKNDKRYIPLREGIQSELCVPLMVDNAVLGVINVETIRSNAYTKADKQLLETIAVQMALAIKQSKYQLQISEHAKELELKVTERTKKLQAANKELETFTYSVSHDLKAPLRGIDGYSKLLLDIYGRNLNDEAQSFLTIIRDSTSLMNQLIEDLLEYSRMERSIIQNDKFKIRDIISTCLNLFSDEIKSGNFLVNVDVSNIEITADFKGLSIALRNMLQNAIKFTKERANPIITIALKENPLTWQLSISDNGIGFNMKYHDRIFDIFQRLHRSENFPGTGIGLAMVAKAISRMGGKVWAESALDIGSTFYIEIPKLIEHEI